MRRSLGLAACLAFAGLSGGCELVAGIQDLSLTAPSDASIAPVFDSSTLDTADVRSASETANGSDADEAGVDASIADAAAGDVGPSQDGAADAPAADASIADAAEAGGGNPFVAPDGAAIALELIDDMEGNSPSTGWLDGVHVNGTWYAFDDMSAGGVLTPQLSGGASALISALSATHVTYNGIVSHRAAQVSANAGFVVYGAGMGFNVKLVTSTPTPFNASAYQGVLFWARATGASPVGVRFNIFDTNTASIASGGACDGGACSGPWGVEFGKESVAALTPDWQVYAVYFSELARPAYAQPVGFQFDPTHMIGCQVQLPEATAGDLWIDDIYFILN